MKRIIGLVLALLILPSLALADTFSVTTATPAIGNIYGSASNRPIACQNTGANNVYISLDGTVASSTNGYLLVASGGMVRADSANAPVTAIASGGSSTLVCTVGSLVTVAGAPAAATSGALTVAEAHGNGDGAFGNNTNFPTGNVIWTTKTTLAGHFTQLTCNTQSLNAGSCTTAPIVNVFDKTTGGAAPLACVNTVQNTLGTTTSGAQTLTFAAGDVIGLYVSTQGGTCLAPTFAVDATITYP